jgi:hypothetical protein
MTSLAVFYNPTGKTWSLFWTRPHYPITNSMSSISINVNELPELIAERVAVLKLAVVDDTIPELGVRYDNHQFIVHVPEDYTIPGLEL